MIRIIRADGAAEFEFISVLQSRSQSMNEETTRAVESIIEDVKLRGDEAVIDYTREFDKTQLKALRLSQEDLDAAADKVSAELYATMEQAAENIRVFHENQKSQGFIQTGEGFVMGQRVIPLARVGLYVPGGTAAYPSSVLMNAIPAKVAGVGEICMVTPAKAGGLNPCIAAAARIAGITEVYTIGGAQAVAALAYGTQSIRAVDKIVGPGNKYVAMAKKLVYGIVDIDMIAGPSEILVIADESANPSYIAADLMSQAEHDECASSVLLTTSQSLAEAVNAELKIQCEKLSRRGIIEKSLRDYGACVITPTIERAIELSNQIAPEHLELAVAEPFMWLDSVKNAGSVFLGEFSPEPLGDYFAGANHVLPTNSTARYASPLGVESFVKRSSYISYSKSALARVSQGIVDFANSEGLSAHANSIEVRMR